MVSEAELERLQAIEKAARDLGLSYQDASVGPFVAFHVTDEYGRHAARIWRGTHDGYVDMRATFAAIDALREALGQDE